MSTLGIGAVVRTKATAVWSVLICATLALWGLGAERGIQSHRLASTIVLVVAFAKVRLVGLYFMELREAPRPLRLVFEGYCGLVFTAVLGMYLLA